MFKKKEWKIIFLSGHGFGIMNKNTKKFYVNKEKNTHITIFIYRKNAKNKCKELNNK